MGVPVVESPGEAEAQCAALAKSGKVFATATEDMDALTFQTPVLLRKMTFANGSKAVIQTMNYQKALEGLGLNQDEFVDLCILLGCDYCDSIRGVGPKTALKLIHEYHSMEKILQNLDRKKYTVPDGYEPGVKKHKVKYDTDEEGNEKDKVENDSEESITENPTPIYVQARRLFNQHEVLDDVDLKFKPCQSEELMKFLVDEQGFNPDRVKSNIEKLQKAFKATSKPQSRMDSFFKIKLNPNAKRIAEKKKEAKLAASSSKKKTGHFGKRKR